MPRSLRWYIFLHRNRLYIYISAGLIIMVSAFCIGWAIHSYRAYLEQQTLYESVQMNSESKLIREQYHNAQERLSTLLQQQNTWDSQFLFVTILDAAMAMNGGVTLQHIEFTDSGFSVDGTATNEDVYHNYRQYVQAHMRKVTCDGKQQVEKESGQCTFHLDGHTKQHDTNSKENHPSL